MGYGDVEALKLLHETAEQLGTKIHQQQGLRIAVVVTDETTAIFSPTPLLIEAGGQPGEKPNAIRLDTPILDPENDASPFDLERINIQPQPLTKTEVEKTTADLKANPPMKFDVARKVRVFNARIEFVEFEMHGVLISRMTAKIPPYLMQLLRDPAVRKRFRGSFQLIEDDTQISTEPINQAKQEIVEKHLVVLRGFGTVILREKKDAFIEDFKKLEAQLKKYKESVETNLQAAIDKNRELLVSELLPGVATNPPDKWRGRLGLRPQPDAVERMLRAELKKKFGSAKNICGDMKVAVAFKGVTYEMLSDPEFIKVASEEFPGLESLHDEFEAARAEEQLGLLWPPRIGGSSGFSLIHSISPFQSSSRISARSIMNCQSADERALPPIWAEGSGRHS
jgi:hypothetical protein